MHDAERALRIGVALRCSKPKQPPRLRKVYRPALAVAVHDAEIILRLVVALRSREPKQPPRFSKVYRPAVADTVHAAEHILRVGVALLCSKHTLASCDLAILALVAHGVFDERRELRRAGLLGERRARAQNFGC